MNKERILSAIKAQGIIAVVRGKNAEHAINVAEACIEGGVTYGQHCSISGWRRCRLRDWRKPRQCITRHTRRMG